MKYITAQARQGAANLLLHCIVQFEINSIAIDERQDFLRYGLIVIIKVGEYPDMA